MQPGTKARVELQGLVQECFRRVRLARAVELARSRRYLEAESLFMQGSRLQTEAPRELDLLARIAAKQGHFGRAWRLWHAALRVAPENADFEQAILLAEAAERKQELRRNILFVTLIAVWTAAILLLLINLISSHASSRRREPDAVRSVELSRIPLPEFESSLLPAGEPQGRGMPR